jgi:DNA polymerase-1
LFRAYHALPPLTNPAGVPVGAVYGFCNMLLRLLKNYPGAPLLVVFDAGRKTFRQDIYPAYKANRPEPPEDLIPQFALVRAATQAFGLPQVELAGFEADDLLASYAAAAVQAGQSVTIVSSDKDLMQLIRPQVGLLDPLKNIPIGADEVLAKFGVPPEQVVEVQALAGDSSDNVPGVPGIGIKTAAELIQRFGSVENLLANLDQISQPKRRETLQTHADLARISRALVLLEPNAPCPLPLADIQSIHQLPNSLRDFFAEQGFRQLLNRMGDAASDTSNIASPPTLTLNPTSATIPSHSAPPNLPHSRPLASLEDLRHWLDNANQTGQLAIIGVQTAAGHRQIALACQPTEQVVVTLANNAPTDLLSPPAGTDDGGGALPHAAVATLLTPLFQDNSIAKIGLDWKALWVGYPELPLVDDALDDLQLMSYVAEGGSGTGGRGAHDLPAIAARFNLIEGWVSQAPAATALYLFPLLQQRMRQVAGLALYQHVDRPLPAVVARMERAGVRLDLDFLRQLNQRFAARLLELEEQVYQLANGKRFTIGSPKQLGVVLFEDLGLPTPKRGKSGAYETGVDVLEPLAAAGHVIAEKVLAWRQIAKLQSTYVEALSRLAKPATARVHTTFLLAQTSTGRFSSIDPNLQNIPIRTTEGRELRTAFIAKPGWQLLSADYSQIELRLLAHLADVPTLRQAFADGIDIHVQTAAEVFHKPLAEVDSQLRRSAKAINFGIIYGISAYGLAAQLGITAGEASEIIKHYFARYPGIPAYMESMRDFARDHGYVTTLFGRRVAVPEIASSNAGRRQFAERAAINAPLQGTAADLVKRAMTRVDRLLQSGQHQSRLLLQVHDELLLEGPMDELNSLMSQICQTMAAAATPAITLQVPLVVEAKIGTTWGQAH